MRIMVQMKLLLLLASLLLLFMLGASGAGIVQSI